VRGKTVPGPLVPAAVAQTLAAVGPGAVRAAARGDAPEADPAALGTAPAVATASRDDRGPRAATSAWARIVLIRHDGTDGAVIELFADLVEFGRDAAHVRFADDRCLAPIHARVERTTDGAVLYPVDRVNGVFVRVSGPVPLAHGDSMLVGRELLRFELVGDDERAVTPLVQDGVVRLGAPAREPCARLRLLLANGGFRDVRYLFGERFVIGREHGDWVFADDEFISRRHAAIERVPQGGFTLADLGSSNGTFVRAGGAVAMTTGVRVRMGHQLFRFELGQG
jgi:pSer/pThr/pTyr-binding forkhead associated (FHA) protein